MNQRLGFSKQYGRLLQKAEKLARQQQSPLIERKHLFGAICKMSPRLFHRLLGANRLYFTDELPFTGGSDTETSETGVTFSSEAYRLLSLHGGVLGDIMDAMGESTVDIPHVGAALLLDPDSEGPVLELCRVNGIEPISRKPQIFDAARKLCRSRAKDIEKQALKKVDFVRKAMQKKLVGLDEAIDKLCTLLWQFWTRPPEERTRPLSIFICGPEGSGKTLLAETLMDAISKLTGVPKIPTLNAGMHSSRDSSRDIVGLDESWKGGPRPGVYTHPIFEYPEGVICLDHVETLHPIALSHVLKAITMGSLKDEGMGKQVNYKNAICLFLSSAGGECPANSAAMTKSRLAEELCHKIPAPDAKRSIQALVEQSTHFIIMTPLDVAGIRTLMRRAVAAEFECFKRGIRHINIDVDAVADILVQSISACDPRAIPSIVANVVEPLRKAMLNEPDQWWKLKTLDVGVEGAAPLDIQEVAHNLHMRKKLEIRTTFSRKDQTATLVIEAQGHSLLPAVSDGIIRVTPPQDSDSFDRLVGISAPLAYAKRWERYFSGQTQIKPESLLLVGPPGCGKTSFVRALASHLQKPFAVLKCSDISNAESLLAAFAAIRKYARDGLLVFLDELDSCAGDRADKSEDYIERLNLLLQQIDGFETKGEAKIMYIGATNRMSALDAAIMRSGRFGQTVVFSPLGEPERRKLVGFVLEECGTEIDAGVADFMAETMEGLNGASIKAICREMALASENTRPTKQDYLRARQVVLDGMFTQRPFLDADETLSVAMHEAGHALCCLHNGFAFVQASIVATGNNLGFLERKNPGLAAHTQTGLIAAMDISLAGRAAQEVVLGQATDGAIGDIKMATGFAMQYVGGGFSYEYGIGIPPDGLEWKEISPIVRKLLESRYAHVKRQFSKEKPLLRRVADLLVKRKVVCEDEIQACCVNCSSKKRQVHHG